MKWAPAASLPANFRVGVSKSDEARGRALPEPSPATQVIGRANRTTCNMASKLPILRPLPADAAFTAANIRRLFRNSDFITS